MGRGEGCGGEAVQPRGAAGPGSSAPAPAGATAPAAHGFPSPPRGSPPSSLSLVPCPRCPLPQAFPSSGKARAPCQAQGGDPCPRPQAGPRWHPLLLALAGPVAAGDPAGARSDRAVGTLVGVLLCLVLCLALAWHHLCRLSAGQYHPWPLGRRALALLRGRWQRLRALGDPAEAPGDADTEVAGRDEEEELMPWSLERRLEREEEEEEEEQEAANEEEDEQEAEASLALEGGESPPSAGQGAGGSAEALLSDLRPFSGTAAWEDTRPNVTAL
ncbi:protein tyrosine phosphatase receptor type C-associated protein [Pipra filicauda]|uniref:Protein tyrosine phosphatase receptor type C-associated protein n=1 Tax=Pipra filicauda TaxID=649802 RepID=A0A7R5L313_9PASS|nr:protein tyrosine phosphatase receptor type C-associated protein [Pipra filicauda]